MEIFFAAACIRGLLFEFIALIDGIEIIGYPVFPAFLLFPPRCLRGMTLGLIMVFHSFDASKGLDQSTYAKNAGDAKGQHVRLEDQRE